jgi:4-aminobutyrate aminotransferase-like enzyme
LVLFDGGCVKRPGFISADETHVFPRELDRDYPLIVRAKGVWLYDSVGNEYLDGIGGGAMVASLGYGAPEIVEAAAEQARAVSFLYNQQFTSPAQERLAWPERAAYKTAGVNGMAARAAARRGGRDQYRTP